MTIFFSRRGFRHVVMVGTSVLLAVLSLFANFICMSDAQAVCRERCDNSVKCVYATVINKQQFGYLYQNNCIRMLKTDRNDGTAEMGSVNNMRVQASVVKVCGTGNNNLNGKAQANCAQLQGQQFVNVACAAACDIPGGG